MENFILITGASTGIGEHAVSILSQLGYSILAGVRNQADATRLKNTFGPKVHSLILDVTDSQDVARAKKESEEILGEHQLVAIINNAGIVISGAVLYIPIEEWEKQMNVNFLGVLRVTQAFFPLLTKSSAGHLHPKRIINISSVSGLFSSPFVGAYAASKYALEAMSDALRRELYMHDIQVVLIEPGSIRTPIWHKAKTNTSYFGPEHEDILAFKDRVIQNNWEKGLDLNALDKVIIAAVKSKKVNPRYLIRPQKWKFQLIRLLPAKMVDKMIRKRLQARSGIRPF